MPLAFLGRELVVRATAQGVAPKDVTQRPVLEVVTDVNGRTRRDVASGVHERLVVSRCEEVNMWRPHAFDLLCPTLHGVCCNL